MNYTYVRLGLRFVPDALLLERILATPLGVARISQYYSDSIHMIIFFLLGIICSETLTVIARIRLRAPGV